MASARKGKLLSFRIPQSDYNYIRSTARQKAINISEFIRIAIEKTRRKPGDSEPTLTEVVAYLKKLTASQRDEILDQAEGSQKRKIRSFIRDTLSQKPGIKGKKLCEMVSNEFSLPITLDLRHNVYLRIKSFRRRKNIVEKLEKEY